MKVVIISDTHGQHGKLSLPQGDMILHAGDISSRGTGPEILDFLQWFAKLDFKYRIFIAGNHDFFFEKTNAEIIRSSIPENVIYLKDSGIEIEGIKIWGSPVTPWFFDWAFNRNRGAEIKKHWDLIPTDTDILITHGPAYKILDETIHGENVGCEDLLEKIKTINPKYYICGHIHEAYGIEKQDTTTYINASVLDQRYRIKNNPVVIEI